MPFDLASCFENCRTSDWQHRLAGGGTVRWYDNLPLSDARFVTLQCPFGYSLATAAAS